ncbi:O-fucosyltransferase family protein [Abeliophyllum distichum]|uniref:O-fucosyltransferase family protein n=1 Tax=Abeliophyllum distichum TaxID=126358 RepID=A0ABD1NQW5_9LAMI
MVIHLVGFGNRLASDPVPSQLQRLRCRCNFHALKFVPKIQEAGALLIQRMRQNDTGLGHLDHYLVGPFAKSEVKGQKDRAAKKSSYLALHLRFEIDMVAHSLCEYGGGEEERRELEFFIDSTYIGTTICCFNRFVETNIWTRVKDENKGYRDDKMSSL